MTKNKNTWLYLMFVLFLCLPTYAYADAGTPLMWVAGFHLLIGNAIVGIFEGLIIARIFHVKFSRSVFIMILANYISMFAGCYWIFLFANHIGTFASLYNLSYILIGLGIVSYLLTILIEWPFTYWVLKGKENRKNLSFKANLVAQTASYALLILIYLSCSGISLITKTKIDRSLSFLKNKKAWVYYLSPRSNAFFS